MNLDKKTLQKVHTLANGFAVERVELELDLIEEKIKGSTGTLTYSRDLIKKDIGRLIATAYAKGYADCAENKDVRRLIF